MAFKSASYWGSMMKGLMRGGSRGRYNTFASSTWPKMKAYAPTADDAMMNQFQHQQRQQQGKGKTGKSEKGDFVSVYVAIGMIALSLSLGLHTAKQQLMYSPTVSVKKKRRETIPEVVEPDHLAEEADQFIKKSFFRKVAGVHEPHLHDYAVPNGPIHGEVYAHKPRVETLKSVGVDPTPL